MVSWQPLHCLLPYTSRWAQMEARMAWDGGGGSRERSQVPASSPRSAPLPPPHPQGILCRRALGGELSALHAPCPGSPAPVLTRTADLRQHSQLSHPALGSEPCRWPAASLKGDWLTSQAGPVLLPGCPLQVWTPPVTAPGARDVG